MFFGIFVTFVNLFVTVFDILLILRVVMSWITLDFENNFFTRLIFNLTEPILSPVRAFIPRTGVLDLAPLIAFVLLWLIQLGVNNYACHLTGIC